MVSRETRSLVLKIALSWRIILEWKSATSNTGGRNTPTILDFPSKKDAQILSPAPTKVNF